MSLVDDEIRKHNEEQVTQGRDSNKERLEELERERQNAERYKNPLWRQYWDNKKANTQLLRNKAQS